MMTYHNKLVVAIKSNGKVLREFKDTVYLKFGSEYSILIKNINTVKTLAHVFIDGTDITPGGLVISAGEQIDLERSLATGSLTEGNALKFIERTGAIEHHRGIKLEDGIVRVEYQFEQVFFKQTWPKKMEWPQPWDQPWYPSYTLGSTYSANATRGVSRRGVSSIAQNSVSTQTYDSFSFTETSAEVNNDAGITVPGSRSEQKFQIASSFPLESEKYSIVLKLLGENPDNKPVTESVTVKHRPRCETCGRQNRATAKFCTECGTHLTIYA